MLRQLNNTQYAVSIMKKKRVSSYIQIVILVCLIMCSGGKGINISVKTNEFPCKGHQCGCRSESDCKRNCCCALYGNQSELKDVSSKQKNSFQVFISSINCKSDSHSLSDLSFTAKYVLDIKVSLSKESFFCFNSNNTSICPPEVFLSLPEKPPRRFI